MAESTDTKDQQCNRMSVGNSASRRASDRVADSADDELDDDKDDSDDGEEKETKHGVGKEGEDEDNAAARSNGFDKAVVHIRARFIVFFSSVFRSALRTMVWVSAQERDLNSFFCGVVNSARA
jgi:hypothetical protein